jgi:ATP-dependent Clp protease ATP-binding subunit ClpA
VQGYNITETVRRALVIAREQCHVLKHEQVEPEHILLGLVDSKDETLLQIWSGLNIDPEKIRGATLAIRPRGHNDHHATDAPYSRSAKQSIEFAMREAMVLKEDSVEPTHLLLGIARLENEASTHMLQERGVTTESIRAALSKLRGRDLAVLGVDSIEVTVKLRGGGVIQRTFPGGDEEIIHFLSEYLLPD